MHLEEFIPCQILPQERRFLNNNSKPFLGWRRVDSLSKMSCLCGMSQISSLSWDQNSGWKGEIKFERSLGIWEYNRPVLLPGEQVPVYESSSWELLCEAGWAGWGACLGSCAWGPFLKPAPTSRPQEWQRGVVSKWEDPGRGHRAGGHSKLWPQQMSGHE